MTKNIALSFAVDFHARTDRSPIADDVLATAHKFDLFLRSDQTDTKFIVDDGPEPEDAEFEEVSAMSVDLEGLTSEEIRDVIQQMNDFAKVYVSELRLLKDDERLTWWLAIGRSANDDAIATVDKAFDKFYAVVDENLEPSDA